MVLGMVEGNSKKVKVVKIESSKTHHLQPTIYENVAEDSNLVTDSRIAFKIHTNSVEGFWSMLKKGVNSIGIR